MSDIILANSSSTTDATCEDMAQLSGDTNKHQSVRIQFVIFKELLELMNDFN
jgi:hypothetical protein